MGKMVSVFKLFGSRTAFRNKLIPKTEVRLWIENEHTFNTDFPLWHPWFHPRCWDCEKHHSYVHKSPWNEVIKLSEIKQTQHFHSYGFETTHSWLGPDGFLYCCWDFYLLKMILGKKKKFVFFFTQAALCGMRCRKTMCFCFCSSQWAVVRGSVGGLWGEWLKQQIL